jgi:hypothetical protein
MSDVPARSVRFDLDELNEWATGAHAGLLRNLSDLSEALHVTSCTERDARIASRLEALEHQLAAHFDAEERSGLFGPFLEAFPRFSRPLERLRREHPAILAQTRALREACARGEDAARRVRALVASIRRHEAEETEILHRAYCEDIGPHD